MVLQLSRDWVSLLDTNSWSRLHRWPLTHVKRFGKDNNVVSLEVGNIDEVPGIYYFATSQMDDVFNTLDL